MSIAVRGKIADLPPLCILPVNINLNELHLLEQQVLNAGVELIKEPGNARLFVTKVSKGRRAAYELRSHGIWTQEIPPTVSDSLGKRKRSEDNRSGQDQTSRNEQAKEGGTFPINGGGLILVLKLEWLKKSLENGRIVSYDQHIVYRGSIVAKPAEHATAVTMHSVHDATEESRSHTVTPLQNLSLKRIPSSGQSARASNSRPLNAMSSGALQPVMKYSPRRFRDQARGKTSVLSAHHPGLKRSSTSEQNFIFESEKKGSEIAMPAWVLDSPPRPSYSCLRSTFLEPPNKEFLAHLYEVKQARLLTGDEIGVRAYSTSIASISAYPRKIQYPSEITRLPGCSEKIAALWVEWHLSAEAGCPDTERHLSVTDELKTNEDVNHLKLFYDIWGVGADTARKFYYDKGWKDLDDVIEYGWSSGALSRVQQIGVKFYDEFKVKLSRCEVEEIADIVLHHARICRNIPESSWSNKQNNYRGNWQKPDDGKGDVDWNEDDMVCVITGGYRRGKSECGDVDVIISHRDQAVTEDLVVDVVKSLEVNGWVTHTLTLHTTNSDRDPQALALRALENRGHGFDTLDKALCVWQDPNFDTNKYDKNPNIHRRVDIIVSPWKTVGAAILGWSGATTFERDIRLWSRKEKGLKYDSSGLRDAVTGAIVDLEKPPMLMEGRQSERPSEQHSDGWEDRERVSCSALELGFFYSY